MRASFNILMCGECGCAMYQRLMAKEVYCDSPHCKEYRVKYEFPVIELVPAISAQKKGEGV